VLGLIALGGLLGCATTPYRFADDGEPDLTLALREGEAQIERGRPNAWVDGFGHYFFSLPSKLVLLNWRVNNHDVGPEVQQSLEEYLRANGLCNAKVRLNQYAPGGEWQRLTRNREMPGFWRYTLGAISVSFYTIFPERLFAGFPIIGGGDHYNPYTNTVSIYSGSRPIALHEGGHARDFADQANRHWKGFYAGLRAVPLLGLPFALWQEAVASNDALSWELATGDSRQSKSAYRTLYPAYGTYVGGTAQTAASFFIDGWILYAIQYGVVVVGHVAGQTRALFVGEREEGLQPELRGAPPGPEPLEPAESSATPDDAPPDASADPIEGRPETQAPSSPVTPPQACSAARSVSPRRRRRSCAPSGSHRWSSTC
jgi:hypothetical protein